MLTKMFRVIGLPFPRAIQTFGARERFEVSNKHGKSYIKLMLAVEFDTEVAGMVVVGAGISGNLPTQPPPKPLRICRGCGASIIYGKNFCSSCGVVIARNELIESAKRGRIAAQSPEAQARRTETQRRNANAQLAWEKSGHTKISDEAYRNEIQPRLARVTIPTLMSALNVCASYAADIRRGRRWPHPRHWESLLKLVHVIEPK